MKNTEKQSVSIHKLKAQLSMHSMMLPAVAFAIVFSIIPLVGIVIAFQNFSMSKGIFGSSFAEPILKHFIILFNQGNFFNALKNTVEIALIKIVAITVCSIILALLINEVQNPILKKVIQTVIFLPYFLSWILLGDMFVEIFRPSGTFNYVLDKLMIKDFLVNTFNIVGESWITDEFSFRIILVVTDLWKNVGYQVVVFLAAITTINSSLYEAAEIDGAGHIQKCWHITVPGIKPMIVLMCILNIGNIMNAGFEQILTMYNPSVELVSEILDTLSYNKGFKMAGRPDYEGSTAISFFKSTISFICFMIAYRIAFKVSDYKLF